MVNEYKTTSALARESYMASRARLRRLVSMDRPLGSAASEAVARRTSRPSVVAGRDDPGRLPLKAVSTVIC